MTNWKIPLSDLDFGDEEMEAVARVLDSKWLSMGPEVEAFESEFARFQDIEYAFAVSSATAGLHLAFLALKIGPGDEVIQPALNFVAASNMTIACGSRPIFADIIDVVEPTIDPAHVARLITPRTKAVVAMHYGGNLCRMSEMASLCHTHGLHLIEDACHAVGTGAVLADGKYRMGGSFGEAGVFSFFANKNMVTGEGGMVVTGDRETAERIRLLRSHGMTTLTWDRHNGHASSYDVVVNGFNYRLDELHAAIGRVQLSKVKRNNGRRRAVLEHYRTQLAGCECWQMPFAQGIHNSSGHLMVTVAASKELRNRAVTALRGAGIQSSMHYPCIPDFKAFEGANQHCLPASRAFASRAITLPCFPDMTSEQVATVVETLNSIA